MGKNLKDKPHEFGSETKNLLAISCLHGYLTQGLSAQTWGSAKGGDTTNQHLLCLCKLAVSPKTLPWNSHQTEKHSNTIGVRVRRGITQKWVIGVIFFYDTSPSALWVLWHYRGSEWQPDHVLLWSLLLQKGFEAVTWKTIPLHQDWPWTWLHTLTWLTVGALLKVLAREMLQSSQFHLFIWKTSIWYFSKWSDGGKSVPYPFYRIYSTSHCWQPAVQPCQSLQLTEL